MLSAHRPFLFLVVLLLLLAGNAARADDGALAEALRTAGATKVDVDKAGQVTDLFFKDSSKITPEQWKLIGQLAHAKKMTFYNQCTLNDDTLPLLAGLTNLEEFACDGANISDKGFAHMTKWTKLRKITFFHPSWKGVTFNGTGFAAFTELKNLESFGLGGALFNDDGFAAVAKLTQLKDFRLWHTRNTPAGNAQLENFKNLTSLYYSPDPRCAAAVVPHLVKLVKLDKLEKLTLMETRFTAKDLEPLQQLTHLKSLELQNVDISEADLTAVKKALPKVEVKWTEPNENAKKMIQKAFETK